MKENTLKIKNVHYGPVAVAYIFKRNCFIWHVSCELASFLPEEDVGWSQCWLLWSAEVALRMETNLAQRIAGCFIDSWCPQALWTQFFHCYTPRLKGHMVCHIICLKPFPLLPTPGQVPGVYKRPGRERPKTLLCLHLEVVFLKCRVRWSYMATADGQLSTALWSLSSVPFPGSTAHDPALPCISVLAHQSFRRNMSRSDVSLLTQHFWELGAFSIFFPLPTECS